MSLDGFSQNPMIFLLNRDFGSFFDQLRQNKEQVTKLSFKTIWWRRLSSVCDVPVTDSQPPRVPRNESKAQFTRRTSHVPCQVVRSYLAVERCPNQFFSTEFN